MERSLASKRFSYAELPLLCLKTEFRLTFVSVCTCMCVYKYMCVHVYVCTCICVYMYMCVQIYVCTNMCVYMYMCVQNICVYKIYVCTKYVQALNKEVSMKVQQNIFHGKCTCKPMLPTS